MTQGRAKLLGLRIKSLKPDMDHDENDQERLVPVGSYGLIWRLNHIDARGEQHYDIGWDNGAWTVYSEDEVRSGLEILGPERYRRLSSGELVTRDLPNETVRDSME